MRRRQPPEASLLTGVWQHVRHHDRFYASAVLGVLVWAATARFAPALRFVVAGDVFFAAYLVSTALLTLRETAADLRERARYEDEGVHLIVVLTLAAISLSLASIFYLLDANGGPTSVRVLFPIVSVPLGWLTLHTVIAFHYARLYYTAGPEQAGVRTDTRGLAFPGTEEPTLRDFLYHSFVIGMTSQVSDVQVHGPEMRQLVLVHGITSFFMNTVLVALAVNVAASYVH